MNHSEGVELRHEGNDIPSPALSILDLYRVESLDSPAEPTPRHAVVSFLLELVDEPRHAFGILRYPSPTGIELCPDRCSALSYCPPGHESWSGLLFLRGQLDECRKVERLALMHVGDEHVVACTGEDIGA